MPWRCTRSLKNIPLPSKSALMGLYQFNKFCSRRFRFLFPRPAPAGRGPERGDSSLVWFRFFSLCGLLRLCARIFVSENPIHPVHPVGNPLPLGVSCAFALKKNPPSQSSFPSFSSVKIFWLRLCRAVLLCPKALHFWQSFSRSSFSLGPSVQILFFPCGFAYPASLRLIYHSVPLCLRGEFPPRIPSFVSGYTSG